MDKCLSTIKTKDEGVIPCCRLVKGNVYQLCKGHYKRRFNPAKLQFKQVNNPHFCHQLLVSGNNRGMYCSKRSFRNQMCYTHLSSILKKCYYPECSNEAFFRTGMCSYHSRNNCPCPCDRHISYQNIDHKNYYCQTHQEIDCDCLKDWTQQHVISNYIYLPNEILEYIFDFGDCYLYSNIKALNKYYSQHSFATEIISKYCFTSNMIILRSPVQIEDRLNYFYMEIFKLLIDTYYIDISNLLNIKVIPTENILEFTVSSPDAPTVVLKYIYKSRYCLITKQNKDIFQKNLNSLYNIYLSNLEQLLLLKNSPEGTNIYIFLENISHKFCFFIEENFSSKKLFHQYYQIHMYLIGVLK